MFTVFFFNLKIMKNLKILYKLLIQWKWQFIWSSILLVFGMFFRSLEPLVIQFVVDALLPALKNQTAIVVSKSNYFNWFASQLIPDITKKYPISFYLLLVGLLYFGISLIKGIIMFSAKAITASATEHAINALRNKVFLHIQKLSMRYFSDSKIGELTQRATGDIETVRSFISTQIVEVIRLLALFIISFSIIYVQHKTFAFVSICLVPLTAIASFFFFNKEQKIWEAHEVESDKLNNLTQENLSGIRVVKAFANEAIEIEKFKKQNQAKLDIALKHARLHTIYWPISDMIVNAQIFLAVLVGAWFTLEGSMTVGQFISFNTYIVMVAFPMRQVSRLLSQMGMALVAVGRIEEVLEEPEESMEGIILNDKIKGNIRFEHVYFKYKDSEDYVLEDIHFEIKAGEHVAMIGPTGAGKSTIIKLLLRFYEPTQGQIFLDDVPLNTISRLSLRQHIGVVLQKAFLFSDTIKNNIAYTNSNKINLIETANISGLSNIDTTFVNGLDTLIGEKGVSLSGGQKQRIALARTLYAEPDVLILDDVTSAVDTITEKEILTNLRQYAASHTTINITHRMSSLAFADKIMIVEQGKLTGFDLAETLAKNNAFFKDVLDIQNHLEKN